MLAVVMHMPAQLHAGNFLSDSQLIESQPSSNVFGKNVCIFNLNKKYIFNFEGVMNCFNVLLFYNFSWGALIILV